MIALESDTKYIKMYFNKKGDVTFSLYELSIGRVKNKYI